MPTSANVNLPLVPSRPHATQPVGKEEDKKAGDGTYKAQGRTSSSEWVDIDDDKPRRRRKVKRTPSSNDITKKQPKPAEKRFVSPDLGRFFPKLSQILETNEPKSQPRSRPIDTRTNLKHDATPTHRRLPYTRESNLQRQQENLLHFNASLLSVISGLTASTDRSSGSNSTVTQRSYRRRNDSVPRRSHRGYRRAMSEVRSVVSSPTRSHVSYEYHDDDQESVVSSVLSSTQQSEVDSSDLPGTPSSRSTYSSSKSPPDSNAKPSQQDSAISLPAGSSSMFSDTSSMLSDRLINSRTEPSLIDGQYYYREHDPQTVDSPSPPHAPLHNHPGVFSSQYFEEVQRSQSHSSASSEQAAHALQHYYAPATGNEAAEPLSLSQPSSGQHTVDTAPHGAPDPPKFGQRTLVGYEKLAVELSCTSSAVKPMYRRFEYLNHRLLLHLQDEIAELEEQLRRADEIIAHMSPAGYHPPASRRDDAYYGADIHHHRTAVLGRIFIKTEQYNKAMSSYSAMTSTCTPADTKDIATYRSWMAKESPISEVEARFLSESSDLVRPGARRSQSTVSTPLVLLGISTLFVLPTVLTSRSTQGSLIVVGSYATGLLGVRLTTSLLSSLSLWHTSACVAVFVLLMSTVVLCVPPHAS